MIYADYAATNGRVPDAVRAQVADYLLQPGNPGRGSHPAAMDAARRVLMARIALAGFFDLDAPERVIFTSGATESLNLALFGFLRPGDHVVTTEMEHNSVLRPLYALEKQGVELTITDGSAEAIAAAMRENTRAVVMTHASNMTGEVLDIRAASQIAHAKNAKLIVDAAQSAGVLPISMREDGVDALCLAGHKGLLGLQGVGALLLAPGMEIRPILLGGSGVHSFDKGMPEAMPEGLEAGTLNVPGIVSLTAGLSVVQSRGPERIAAHEAHLTAIFRSRIVQSGRVSIYGDCAKPHAGVTSLNIDGMDAGRVGELLAGRYGIAARTGAHCAPLAHAKYGIRSSVRLSFGWDNTEAEAAVCAEAILDIAEGGLKG